WFGLLLRLPPGRHHRRRLLAGRSAVTPAAKGGNPDAAQSASHHAARCPARSPLSARPASPAVGSRSASGPDPGPGPAPAGDQDARISNPVAAGSSCFAPNPSVTTGVTVPLGSSYPAVRLSSASVSQLQPTCPISGSAAISGSSSARM